MNRFQLLNMDEDEDESDEYDRSGLSLPSVMSAAGVVA
jgi:hypothetical protein